MNLYINNNKKYKELFPKKHYSNIKNIELECKVGNYKNLIQY